MGFRLRKSINFGGGFRINLSKSGVGYSWGVPGYRITKTAKGRTRRTYSIPGTGISYVNESHKKRFSQNKNYSHPNTPQSNYSQQNNIMQDIDSAPIEQFQSAEYHEFTDNISKLIKWNIVSNVLLWCVLLGLQPILLILPLAGLIIKIILHTKWKMAVEYTIEDVVNREYNNKIEAWFSLNNCSAIWQIIQFSSVNNQKINAGASRKINRIPFRFYKKIPFYLAVNVDTVQMKLKKEKLIFLPDKILLIRGSKVGAISYSSIDVNVSDVRFIESGYVPKDAQVIDYTWQFVNKNGTPDKRYRNNRRLPICLYSKITVISSEGLNIELQCSNTNIAKRFENAIKTSY